MFFDENIADLWLINKKARLMKHPERSDEKIEEILRTIISKQEKYVGKDVDKLVASLNDPKKIRKMKSLKEFVLIGTNDINRCIEKNIELNLVICCGSNDEWVCQGLLCESLLRNIPICAVNGLSDVLSSHLGVSRVRAIAFTKVKASPFNDLVEFIIDKIPNISSPWSKLWGEEGLYGKKPKCCLCKDVHESADEDRDTDAARCTCINQVDMAIPDGTIKPKDILHNKPDAGHMNKLINNTEYLEMNIKWKEKTNALVPAQKDKDLSKT